MRTIEQKRAANAMERVNHLSNKSDDFRKRYRSYVDRLGPAIIMNGLGQALATERAAAGEKAHYELYQSLQKWLCRDDGGIYPPGEDVLDAIMMGEQSLYLRAQIEALAWLEWHKKFCRASFPADEGNGE